MGSLKQKIKNTALLSDEDKIAVLTAMDAYPQSDLVELEKIIDEFDATHAKAVAQYKASVYGVLDDVASKATPEDAARMKSAADQVKQGIDILLF